MNRHGKPPRARPQRPSLLSLPLCNPSRHGDAHRLYLVCATRDVLGGRGAQAPVKKIDKLAPAGPGAGSPKISDGNHIHFHTPAGDFEFFSQAPWKVIANYCERILSIMRAYRFTLSSLFFSDGGREEEGKGTSPTIV